MAPDVAQVGMDSRGPWPCPPGLSQRAGACAWLWLPGHRCLAWISCSECYASLRSSRQSAFPCRLPLIETTRRAWGLHQKGLGFESISGKTARVSEQLSGWCVSPNNITLAVCKCTKRIESSDRFPSTEFRVAFLFPDSSVEAANISHESVTIPI